jgi:hypothetical protein
VWKVLSQPWLAWPLSAEGLRINLAVDILDRLAVAEAEVNEFLRKALVNATERSVEEAGRRANSLNDVVRWFVRGCSWKVEAGLLLYETSDPPRHWTLLFSRAWVR